MQITSDIFMQTDDRSAKPLIDVIEDKAAQKGTGEWMVTEALQRQEPASNKAAAVMMRHMSAKKAQRQAAGQLMQGPSPVYGKNRQALVEHLRDGYYAAAVITYAQGMALLRKASPLYGNQLDPATVARIWRGGCIIRAVILEVIQAAYEKNPDLTNLLMDPSLNDLVHKLLPALRAVVRAGVDLGIPLPGMMSALAHFDAYRSERLPANLIMAQWDYFGAHGYERIDAQGTFHTHWPIQ